MRFGHVWLCFFLVTLSFTAELISCQNEEFDVSSHDHESGNAHLHRQRNPKIKATKYENEFDIHENATMHHSGTKNSESRKTESSGHKSEKKLGKKDSKRSHKLPRRKGNRKVQRERQEEQERDWHYCSDGRRPKQVEDLEIDDHAVGHMCRELYPTSTCCFDHDLTMELVGDKILEQVPEMQCARMLMKLRCAHCSPRSWWLFHAPDMVRYPHKRVLPIMCPSFCRRFHRLCRDSVAGLEGDNFCQYHTTNEEGPCFPDSFVKRGTID
ncbi:uncharacterized protein LOC120339533 [Styela clava]|uniref:hedgehog-interacting protein-like n=1 Tax=Styela clava TaxID=7725 RepID=UPI00193A0971|nr:hedgehog-interacting protein-like [Styela clava]